MQSVRSADTIIRTVLKSGGKRYLYWMIYESGMREVLSDPRAFWMGGKHSSSVQTTKGAELGCLWLQTSCAVPAGRGEAMQAASTAPISPVAQQCLGEARCSSFPPRSHGCFQDSCSNPSKEQTQLHSTFPINSLCSGKCQGKEAHPLAYGCFPVCFAWWPKLQGQDYPRKDVFSSPA